MHTAQQIFREAGAAAARGELPKAAALLAELADCDGAGAEIRMQAAFTAFRIGELGLAERLLRLILGDLPEAAAIHLNLGNVLQAQGRLDEAVAATARAAELAPDNAMAEANLGGLLEQCEQPDRAEAAYRRALALRPGEAGLHDALGRTLAKQARFDEAEACFARALEIDPRLALAHFDRANAFQVTDRLKEAEAAYRQALQVDSRFAPARNNLALVLQKTGRLEAAEAELHLALRAAPADVITNINLATVRLDRGDADDAVACCDRALATAPFNPTALSFKAIALAEAGRTEAARALADVDRFVREVTPVVPAGYATMADFNAALYEQVAAAPDRFSEPGTPEGRQTWDLMRDAAGALADYREMINAAVADYLSALPRNPNHPFPAGRPNSWDLVAWGTIMREIRPGETSHIHPTAWLSGVYYARLPDAVNDSDPDRSGWLEIGRPPVHFRTSFEPELRLIRPREGGLVLFPSYFYHRVRPFKSDSYRMSVAFDAVATG